MLSTWKNELAHNLLHKEVSALNTVFISLQGTTSFDKWKYFFNKEPAAPDLLKLVQQSVSIPVSNVGVKRILRIMGNLC